MVNTNKPILEDYQRYWGGTVDVHHQGDEKTRLVWVWRIYGDTAAQFLADVLPILREKAPQAYLGLHFRTLAAGDPGREFTRRALSLLKKTSHF